MNLFRNKKKVCAIAITYLKENVIEFRQHFAFNKEEFPEVNYFSDVVVKNKFGDVVRIIDPVAGYTRDIEIEYEEVQ